MLVWHWSLFPSSKQQSPSHKPGLASKWEIQTSKTIFPNVFFGSLWCDPSRPEILPQAPGCVEPNLNISWYISSPPPLPPHLTTNSLLCIKFAFQVQGGSDKSGIIKIFLENLTAQLKIIQFYKIKKQFTEGHIENQDIQWNCCHRRRQPRSWTWTSSMPLPRCPSQGSPSTPSSSGSGPGFFCETLHWPITEKRHTQNSPKGCSQVSWEARPPCPTPPEGSPWSSTASSCLPPTWVTSPHNIRLYSISGPPTS